MDVSDIFRFFSAWGRGRGESQAAGKGGASVLIDNPRPPLHLPARGVGGEGPGGCLPGILGRFLDFFFSLVPAKRAHGDICLVSSIPWSPCTLLGGKICKRRLLAKTPLRRARLKKSCMFQGAVRIVTANLRLGLGLRRAHFLQIFIFEESWSKCKHAFRPKDVTMDAHMLSLSMLA